MILVLFLTSFGLKRLQTKLTLVKLSNLHRAVAQDMLYLSMGCVQQWALGIELQTIYTIVIIVYDIIIIRFNYHDIG